jgi:hypothetical protein
MRRISCRIRRLGNVEFSDSVVSIGICLCLSGRGPAVCFHEALGFLTLMKAFLGAIALFAVAANSDQTQISEDQSPSQLKQGIEKRHPADYYVLVAKLFRDASTKQEALFWFYVGQLRYRYYLAANPHLPCDGDPAVFASLSGVVGRPINEYAGGKPDLWIAEIDHALEWDATHDNDFTPKNKSPDNYRQIRAGLVALRDQVVAMKKQLPELRRQNGLK